MNASRDDERKGFDYYHFPRKHADLELTEYPILAIAYAARVRVPQSVPFDIVRLKDAIHLWSIVTSRQKSAFGRRRDQAYKHA
jgi:hypothetical protein